jgi:hypothetical protein
MQLATFLLVIILALTPAMAQVSRPDGTLATAGTDYDAAPTVQYVTPASADTISVTASRNTIVLINPSGTIAALTVNLPSSPLTGDIVTLSSSQIVTVLTVGNGTLVGTLTTLTVGGFARFCYSSTANKWFRIG